MAEWRRSDRELLAACREGEEGAWKEVIGRYERLVFSIPLSYGLSREDAADIAQLCFTILIENLERLEATNLGGWLSTVARRQTWRRMERRGKEHTVEEDDLVQVGGLLGGEKDRRIERRELVMTLDGALSELDERCRMLIMALYLETEEPSYEEVAERLGMAVGSIGPTRARCLQKLREMLSGE